MQDQTIKLPIQLPWAVGFSMGSTGSTPVATVGLSVEPSKFSEAPDSRILWPLRHTERLLLGPLRWLFSKVFHMFLGKLEYLTNLNEGPQSSLRRPTHLN